MRPLIVTIDGPAGAGKTTVGRKLADRLGYRYIDTGALYRAVAYEAAAASIAADQDSELARLCERLTVTLVRSEGPDGGVRVVSNGVDITDRIRSPEITMLASGVSARPPVRRFLLGLQRDLGREKNVVAEGRDMGTVVFPDAEVKFFLVADAEIRAKRRYLEATARSGQDLEAVKTEMALRDRNDSTRALAPLKPAADAVVVDATELSIAEVVDRMAAAVDRARHAAS